MNTFVFQVSAAQRAAGSGGGIIEDPVRAICDLKSKLAGVTAQRNDLQNTVQDLTDEIGELQRYYRPWLPDGYSHFYVFGPSGI